MSRQNHARVAPTTGVEVSAEVQAMMAHIDALDPFIHQPTRLVLLLFLAKQQEAVSYEMIRTQHHLDPGAISREVTRLAQRGLVTVERRLQGHVATAWVALTPAGREAITQHMTHLLAALGATDAEEV